MSYPTCKIGDDDVSLIGFGAMGISVYYGPVAPDEERFKVNVAFPFLRTEKLIALFPRFLTLRFSMAATSGTRPMSMEIAKSL